MWRSRTLKGDRCSAAASAASETVLERFVYRDGEAFRGWGGGGYHGKARLHATRKLHGSILVCTFYGVAMNSAHCQPRVDNKQALVRPQWVRAMTIHSGLLRRGARSVTAPAERLSIAHYASAAVARPTASGGGHKVQDDGLQWAAPYVQRHVEEAMRAHMWPATAA
jgi:hypothetical protein